MTDILSFRPYTKAFHVGQRDVGGLLDDVVLVEEKIDGSQFSFGIRDGRLWAQSKSCLLSLESPEKMFAAAIQVIKKIPKEHLCDGFAYRCEYLKTPKHNTLCYDRTPENHLIGFDVELSDGTRLAYPIKKELFKAVGLETVPDLFIGKLSQEVLIPMLNTTSVLGGSKIEGVVIKSLVTNLSAKFVSEEFKEVHQSKKERTNKDDHSIIEIIALQYRTQARWNKAIQHLSERGVLEVSPKDIGLLVREVPADIKSECEEEIKQALFDWAWPLISRQVIDGLPQHYKERLLSGALKKEDE